MVGLNDVIWSFIGQLINVATLNADVLLTLQILVDLFSVLIAFLILWWFFKLPFKILKWGKGGYLNGR